MKVESETHPKEGRRSARTHLKVLERKKMRGPSGVKQSVSICKEVILSLVSRSIALVTATHGNRLKRSGYYTYHQFKIQ